MRQELLAVLHLPRQLKPVRRIRRQTTVVVRQLQRTGQHDDHRPHQPRLVRDFHLRRELLTNEPAQLGDSVSDSILHDLEAGSENAFIAPLLNVA